MTKENNENPDELKKDLDDLDAKIQDALIDGNLSEEGLKTLIKETKEIQKRLLQASEDSEEEEGNS